MKDRLTKRHDNSIYGTDGCMSGCDTCSWCECSDVHEMIAKLAHYEDLEEQGRLHIVPKEFWDKIMERFIKDECPFDYGLVGLNEADCKVDDVRCKECWEKALRESHELIEQLSELPNQEAEVKLLIGNELYSVLGMWTNSRPVIIEGGVKRD